MKKWDWAFFFWVGGPGIALLLWAFLQLYPWQSLLRAVVILTFALVWARVGKRIENKVMAERQKGSEPR